MVGLPASYARSGRPMNLQLRSRIGLVVLALLAAVLAACGSSTAPATPSTGAVAPVVPSATATAVPVAPKPAAPPNLTTTPDPTSTATPPHASVATPIAQPSLPGATQETPIELASRLAVEAWDFLTVLTQDVSPRASATHQERAAAEFLTKELEAMGYEAELQPFTADVESSEMMVGEEALELLSLPMRLSGTGLASPQRRIEPSEVKEVSLL